MNDYGFRQMMVNEHTAALERASQRYAASRPRATDVAARDESLVLRLCSVHDDFALERLAALDGKAVPRGRFVVAEENGTLVAALPLYGGPVIADPFRRTEHLVTLLRVRAGQLEPATSAPRWRALVPHRRAVARRV
jgi:hypothetical protein